MRASGGATRRTAVFGLLAGTCAAAPPSARAAPAAGTGYAYLGGRIDEETPARFLRLLDRAVRARTTRLTLVMNTRGGDVGSGLALYEILRAAPVDLAAYNLGAVDSIGVFVFLAAAARIVHPRASFLMHAIGDGSDKPAEPSADRKAVLETSYAREWAILRERTRMPEATFRRTLAEQTIIPADLAVDLGIATGMATLPFPFGETFFE